MSAAVVFKVGEALADKYHGAGHAVAAVADRQIVDLVYIRRILPDYDDEAGLSALQQAIASDQMAPIVLKLGARGDVFVGMCSNWEFVVL